MSNWKDYVGVMSGYGLQVSGIFGQEGGVWAASDNLKATQEEIANLVTGVKSQQFNSPVTLGGKPYMVIGRGPDSVTLKGKDPSDDQNNYLMHVALGKSCAVVGGMVGSNERSSTIHVETMRDHLTKSGF